MAAPPNLEPRGVGALALPRRQQEPANWAAMASIDGPAGSTVTWSTRPLATATITAAMASGSAQAPSSRPPASPARRGEEAAQLTPQPRTPDRSGGWVAWARAWR